MELRNAQGQTEAEFLAAYDPNRYPRPSVTVDMVIFTVASVATDDTRKLPAQELRLLLIQRADHPFLGQWALPGGFVRPDESLDAAAARELREETGIDGIYMEQLYTWGDVGRDPRTRVISASYLSLVNADDLHLQAGDDAAAARWFTLQERLLQETRTPSDNGYALERRYQVALTSGEVKVGGVVRVVKTVEGRSIRWDRQIEASDGIAFDHLLILHYGLDRLRSKIEWTDIAFSLMPERFTIAELRQVYEVILGRELHAGNFRRDIAPKVIETNEVRQERRHRHARLFRFNPRWEEQR